MSPVLRTVSNEDETCWYVPWWDLSDERLLWTEQQLWSRPDWEYRNLVAAHIRPDPWFLGFCVLLFPFALGLLYLGSRRLGPTHVAVPLAREGLRVAPGSRWEVRRLDAVPLAELHEALASSGVTIRRLGRWLEGRSKDDELVFDPVLGYGTSKRFPIVAGTVVYVGEQPCLFLNAATAESVRNGALEPAVPNRESSTGARLGSSGLRQAVLSSLAGAVGLLTAFGLGQLIPLASQAWVFAPSALAALSGAVSLLAWRTGPEIWYRAGAFGEGERR
jgi:hypothetical protein